MFDMFECLLPFVYGPDFGSQFPVHDSQFPVPSSRFPVPSSFPVHIYRSTSSDYLKVALG